jgi:hypothetical protein
VNGRIKGEDRSGVMSKNQAKRSNVIQMPKSKPGPSPEELELWRLEGLDEEGYFQPTPEQIERLRKEGYFPPEDEEV